MNIKEGEKRLSKTLTWVIAMFFWILCTLALMILIMKRAGDIGEAILAFYVSFIILLIVGFNIKGICNNIVMWVIKGFVNDIENKD
jgi:cell division protein FtsW (lipid II flippase)